MRLARFSGWVVAPVCVIAAWLLPIQPATGAMQEPVVIQATAALPPVEVAVGHSAVLQFAEPVERTSVNDIAIADVVVVSPTQLLVHGKQVGSTSLVVWVSGTSQVMTVMVEQDLDGLRRALRQVLPKEPIEVQSAAGVVVLSGEVSSKDAADESLSVARAHTEKAVSLLRIPAKQVLIEVRFAEVDRSLAKSLGVDYVVQGPDYTQSGFLAGNLSPQLPATPRFSRVVNGRDLLLSSTVSHLFELRRGTDISVALNALEEQGLIRILAEPNLLAMSGEHASFLAGGEFPIPVVQSAATGGAANNAVTIEFKEFGIRLDFEPIVTSDEAIRMLVEPEVSVLDFGPAAVRLGGFSIPGLVTRRASTTVQMRSGESLVIGGLLSQMETRTDRRLPWLGSVPVLGKLFSSEKFKNEETELLVLVTPRLTQPTTLQAHAPASDAQAVQQAFDEQRATPPYADSRGDALRGAIKGPPHQTLQSPQAPAKPEAPEQPVPQAFKTQSQREAAAPTRAQPAALERQSGRNVKTFRNDTLPNGKQRHHSALGPLSR